MQTQQIDESALRRTEFRAGQAVELADGQSWSIPCPTVDYVPTFGPEGQVGVELVSSFGPLFDRKVQILRDADTTADEAVAFFNLAVDLLDRNYDLGPDHYRTLLRYRPGDQERNRPLGEIFQIAIGRGTVVSTTEPVTA